MPIIVLKKISLNWLRIYDLTDIGWQIGLTVTREYT